MKKTASLTRVLSIVAIIIAVAACDYESAPYKPGGGGGTRTFENARQLTSDVSDIKPRWSPSGNKIVFERRGFIYYAELLSGGVFLMTRGMSPCWSPDGQYIAYILDGELYTIHDIPERPVMKRTIAANASYVSGIDWGGDNEILYFHQADSANPHQRLYIYDLNRNETRPVLHADLGMCEWPSWSPDKAKILFSSQTMGICWIDSRTEALNRVVEYGVVGKCCWYWTTDSLFVMFNENGTVFRIEPDGTDRKTLYENSFYPGSMSYNAATRQLTFNYSGIWIMDWPPEPEDPDQHDP